MDRFITPRLFLEILYSSVPTANDFRRRGVLGARAAVGGDAEAGEPYVPGVVDRVHSQV